MQQSDALPIEWSESESGNDSDVPSELADEMLLDDVQPSATSRGRGGGRGGGRREREQHLDEDVLALINRAQAEFLRGDHDAAIELAEEAIAIDGTARIAYNLLTAIYDDKYDAHKALMAKVAATHLNKQSKDDWIDIAERSYELGLLNQAAVFFQHASRVARADWTLLLKRAELHASLGEFGRASALLHRIRNKFFDTDPPVIDSATKTQVLLMLARVLKQSGQETMATDLYLDIYNRNLDPARFGPPSVELNWQNLNVLSELLYDRAQYTRAVAVIRNGARWILGRGHERFWLSPPFSDDDSEFDERRHIRNVPRLGPPAKYGLPIDVRVWLLVCRLRPHERTYSETDALVHLDYLRQCVPVEEYSDLYVRAAQAFFHAQLWEPALELYTALTDIPWDTREEYLEMNVGVARCQMQLRRDLPLAEHLLLNVVEQDGSNVEALVALAELYQWQNRTSDVQRIVSRVNEVRDTDGTDPAVIAATETPAAGLAPSLHSQSLPEPTEGMFVDNPGPPGAQPQRQSARPSRAERAENERRAQLRADAGFEALTRYEQGMDAGNTVATTEWVRHAMDLIALFASHRKFFPSDRTKIFVPGDGRIDERVNRLQIAQQDEDEQTPIHEAVVYRGRPIEVWFSLFMRCALAQADTGGTLSSALEILRIARAANVFFSDPQRDKVIALVQLACGWCVSDGGVISDTLRSMYMQHQFSPTVLQLYAALLGREPMQFGSSNNQKFFLRQIKAVDAAVHKEQVPGAARIIDRTPTRESPLLFMLYAYIMLLGPSYVPALTYLMRAHEHLPRHPVVLLTLAVVHVQRAIQRVSPNRHIQILEGLSCLQEYSEVRSVQGGAERQEVCYNMGRFFHGIGLFSIAVSYYEKVLDVDESMGLDPAFDFRRDAAYNLHLIFALSGNMARARSVVSEYLIV